MNVESIPKFTGPAAKLWATVSTHAKKLLLSNVWCGHCSHSVTITDFTGTVKGGDLVLEGLCVSADRQLSHRADISLSRAPSPSPQRWRCLPSESLGSPPHRHPA